MNATRPGVYATLPQDAEQSVRVLETHVLPLAVQLEAEEQLHSRKPPVIFEDPVVGVFALAQVLQRAADQAAEWGKLEDVQRVQEVEELVMDRLVAVA